jgi:hypothetical protein
MKKGKKTLPAYEMSRSYNNREGSLSPDLRDDNASVMVFPTDICGGNMKPSISSVENVSPEYLQRGGRRYSAERYVKSANKNKNLNKSTEGRLTATMGSETLLSETSLDVPLRLGAASRESSRVMGALSEAAHTENLMSDGPPNTQRPQKRRLTPSPGTRESKSARRAKEQDEIINNFELYHTHEQIE